MNDKHLKLLTAVSQGKGEICTAVAEAMQELQLYRALCDGYTLDELARMSLTFKAQIDVLRGRVAVPEEPTAAMRDAFLLELDPYDRTETFAGAYRTMLEAAK